MNQDAEKIPSKYNLLSQSILNGVIGDYLEQENNPLAIQMGFYHQLKKIDIGLDLHKQLGDVQLTNKVVVLVHGLTNLETVWDFERPDNGKNSEYVSQAQKENYGTKLQNEFGHTPLYLRYNTGLPVESNGRQLSELLESLFEHYPLEIEELVLVGFSMGGLLLRHAQKDAIDCNKQWLTALSKCIYIGTPHEGSPFEKFGHIAGEIVRNMPIDHINHWAQWIDIRSQGIKDLKIGLKSLPSNQQDECESFYSGSNHYFISGSVGSNQNSISGQIFGDTLVRKSSAIPSSKPNDSQYAQFENLPHVPLAHSEKVYETIAKWMNDTPSKVTLKRLASKSTPNKALEIKASPSPSNQEMIFGAIDVISDTAYRVLKTTETMHKSIAKIPFGVLRQIPLVKQFRAPVENVHSGISEMVYQSLETGRKKAHRLTKKARAHTL